MKLLFESIPALLFLLALIFYKYIPSSLIEIINNLPEISFKPNDSSDSIYFATLIAIISAGISALSYSINAKSIDKKQTIIFLSFLLLGGATLVLRDPTFILWKPTIVNLIFAFIFLGSMFIGEKLLAERLLGGALDAPKEIWLKLNYSWILFFIALSIINLYVAYNFNIEIWGYFKVFGMMGLTIAFIILQMILLSRYITVKPEE